MLIPSMANFLGAEKNDLPHLYLFNSATEKAVPFPSKLDDINNFSPELVMAWAEKTLMQIEIDHFVETITEVKESTAEEGATEEEKAEFITW